MKTTLIKFTKRKNYFGTLKSEWANLFQGRQKKDEIDALFEEESPKKRRALELSASFSSAQHVSGESVDTFVKQAEKDIAQAKFAQKENPPTPKRSKTHPSSVERVNEWYQEVLKHGESGAIGLVPQPWQAKVQPLKGATLDIVEHYARWREKK